LDFNELNFTNAEQIYLNLTSQREAIVFNSEKIDLSNVSQAEVEIDAFKGTFTLKQTAIDLVGQTSKLSINKIQILPKETGNINGKFNFESASIFLSLSDFNYNATGKLIFGEEKAQILLTDEFLELKNFKGTFAVKNKKLYVNGTADNVNIGGKEFHLLIN
ncbi:MAG: hypothetical protein QXQ79_00725, partial [Candidatus Nanoarchaeia archaeon]